MHRNTRSARITTLVIGLTLLSLIVWAGLATAAPLTDAQRVQRAWKLASAVGRYHFLSDIVHTSQPTARLENAGRSARTQHVRVDGQGGQPA